MEQQEGQDYEAQRGVPYVHASLDSTAQAGLSNGGDWQEEVYQKMKHMKDKYLSELNEMYLNFTKNLKQNDSLPQQPNLEQLEKIKSFKSALEGAIAFLQVPKSCIQPGHKEKLVSCEKFINFLYRNKPRKAVPQMQQQQQQRQPGQLPSSHMLPQMQQRRQQPSQHSQLSQVQPLENQQMNPQRQSMSSQGGSMPRMQQSNLLNLQQNSGLPQQQLQSLMRQQQNPSMDIVGQRNAMTQPTQQQLIPPFSLQQQQQQQNPGCGPQLGSMNLMCLKRIMRAIQQTNPTTHQQHQQQQELRKIIGKLMAQEIRIMQMEDMMRMRQQNMAVKPNVMPQQSGTPLQYGSLPSLAPYPSIPVAPSPMPGDSKKPVPVPSPSNVASRQSDGVGADVIAAPQAHSLAVGTSGISLPSLLAELSSPDGTHGNELAAVSRESSVTERPVDRLTRVVKSVSSKAAVSDIRSVVSTMDRIESSAPWNGSRAAECEDLEFTDMPSFKRPKLQANRDLADKL